MALSVQTNYSSLVAQNALNQSNDMLSTAMQRLGTGYRINSSADDAAGLQIANRLESQTSGMEVAQRNSQDAIGMLQTADSALDETSSIVLRMQDLATQAANGTNSSADLSAMNDEYGELKTELGRIMTDTKYAGSTLLEGGKMAESTTFQIGASSSETLEFNASSEISGINTARTALSDLDSGDNARTEMDALDTLSDAIGTARSKFGSNINRLQHTMNNLASISENTEDAKGRIMDADFASETSNMTKQQLLMQSGISSLRSANSMTSLVSSLLQ